MEIKNKIRFNNNYPKLHNQKTARLLACFSGMSYDILVKKLPDLVAYDTRRDDGFSYELAPGFTYMLLLFEGDKGILFSTIRKDNDENYINYAIKEGDMFKIVIEYKGEV